MVCFAKNSLLGRVLLQKTDYFHLIVHLATCTSYHNNESSWCHCIHAYCYSERFWDSFIKNVGLGNG